MHETLVVSNQIHLSPIRPEDRAACVLYLNDPDIYARTLRIPKEYNDTHFDQWMDSVSHCADQAGRPVHFAIRNGDDQLIGACGFENLVENHKAGIGYWLGRPFWGRGIMTEVVCALRDFGIRRFELVRVWAHVFDFNGASARVLEKNGFQLEGLLRKHIRKDDQLLDTRVYAYVRCVAERLGGERP